MWIWIWWIYPYYILIWWMLIYVDIYIDDECDLFHQCQDEPSRLPEFGRWLVLIFSAISKTWFGLKEGVGIKDLLYTRCLRHAT